MDSETLPAPSPAPDVGTESKAQEQARLRRERRNAKIQAAGSERLSKITSLSGRPAAAEAELAKSSTSPAVPKNSQQNATSEAPDPAEVDISQMQQTPSAGNAEHLEQQAMLLRQMLAGTENGPPGGSGTRQQQHQQQPHGTPEDDPMIRMMQQMLGGMGPDQTGGPGQDGIPAGLAEMFGGTQNPQPETRQADYIWRIVHALCSIVLAMYIALTFSFTGSKRGRVQFSREQGHSAPQVFWMFTTVELGLQSSRYFIDKGKLPASGILGGLGRMLPDPYGRYIRLFSRYSIIYTTIMSDAMLIIFVLGCAAWWQGLAGQGVL